MKPITTLLVDDEAPFIETMAKRLGRRNMTVLTASNGQEALDLLAGGSGAEVDVAVLDVKMPGMNGLELLAAIRQRFPLIESLMLTGHATVSDAIEGMKHGAYDYLMKPCDIEVLDQKIQDACKVKRERENHIREANAHLIALRRGD